MPQLPINLLGVQPKTGGFDYPPGMYLFKVVDVTLGTTKDGQTQRVNIKNEIVAGPGSSTEFAGRPIYSGFNLTEDGAGFFKNFLNAIGYTDDILAQTGGQPHSEMMVERQYTGDVIKRNNFTNIVNERPASDFQEALKTATPMPAMLGSNGGAATPQQQFATTQQFVAPQQFAAPPQQIQQPQFAPPQMQQPPMQQQQFAPPPQQQQIQMPPAVSQPMPNDQVNQFPAPPPPPGQVGGQGQ